eukprot:scaffold45673_cov175-Skeletonema_marinoi.AAC.2
MFTIQRNDLHKYKYASVHVIRLLIVIRAYIMKHHFNSLISFKLYHLEHHKSRLDNPQSRAEMSEKYDTYLSILTSRQSQSELTTENSCARRESKINFER